MGNKAPEQQNSSPDPTTPRRNEKLPHASSPPSSDSSSSPPPRISPRNRGAGGGSGSGEEKENKKPEIGRLSLFSALNMTPPGSALQLSKAPTGPGRRIPRSKTSEHIALRKRSSESVKIMLLEIRSLFDEKLITEMVWKERRLEIVTHARTSDRAELDRLFPTKETGEIMLKDIKELFEDKSITREVFTARQREIFLRLTKYHRAQLERKYLDSSSTRSRPADASQHSRNTNASTSRSSSSRSLNKSDDAKEEEKVVEDWDKRARRDSDPDRIQIELVEVNDAPEPPPLERAIDSSPIEEKEEDDSSSGSSTSSTSTASSSSQPVAPPPAMETPTPEHDTVIPMKYNFGASKQHFARQTMFRSILPTSGSSLASLSPIKEQQSRENSWGSISGADLREVQKAIPQEDKLDVTSLQTSPSKLSPSKNYNNENNDSLPSTPEKQPGEFEPLTTSALDRPPSPTKSSAGPSATPGSPSINSVEWLGSPSGPDSPSKTSLHFRKPSANMFASRVSALTFLPGSSTAGFAPRPPTTPTSLSAPYDGPPPADSEVIPQRAPSPTSRLNLPKVLPTLPLISSPSSSPSSSPPPSSSPSPPPSSSSSSSSSSASSFSTSSAVSLPSSPNKYFPLVKSLSSPQLPLASSLLSLPKANLPRLQPEPIDAFFDLPLESGAKPKEKEKVTPPPISTDLEPIDSVGSRPSPMKPPESGSLRRRKDVIPDLLSLSGRSDSSDDSRRSNLDDSQASSLSASGSGRGVPVPAPNPEEEKKAAIVMERQSARHQQYLQQYMQQYPASSSTPTTASTSAPSSTPLLVSEKANANTEKGGAETEKKKPKASLLERQSLRHQMFMQGFSQQYTPPITEEESDSQEPTKKPAARPSLLEKQAARMQQYQKSHTRSPSTSLPPSSPSSSTSPTRPPSSPPTTSSSPSSLPPTLQVPPSSAQRPPSPSVDVPTTELNLPNQKAVARMSLLERQTARQTQHFLQRLQKSPSSYPLGGDPLLAQNRTVERDDEPTPQSVDTAAVNAIKSSIGPPPGRLSLLEKQALRLQQHQQRSSSTDSTNSPMSVVVSTATDSTRALSPPQKAKPPGLLSPPGRPSQFGLDTITEGDSTGSSPSLSRKNSLPESRE